MAVFFFGRTIYHTVFVYIKFETVHRTLVITFKNLQIKLSYQNKI